MKFQPHDGQGQVDPNHKQQAPTRKYTCRNDKRMGRSTFYLKLINIETITCVYLSLEVRLIMTVFCKFFNYLYFWHTYVLLTFSLQIINDDRNVSSMSCMFSSCRACLALCRACLAHVVHV